MRIRYIFMEQNKNKKQWHNGMDQFDRPYNEWLLAPLHHCHSLSNNKCIQLQTDPNGSNFTGSL